MRFKNLVTTATAAAVTAAITLTLLGPGAVTANTPPQEAMQQRVRGVIGDVDGLQVSIGPLSKQYEPGDEPAVTLTAYNPGPHAISRTVQVRMTTASPAPPYARMLPMPVERWKEECELYVEAGQEKRVTLATGVELAAGQMVCFHVQQGERSLGMVASSVRFDDAAKQPALQIY